MVKYRFEFSNIDDVTYTGELSNINYTGQVIEVNGSCTLDRQSEVFQPLQVTTCNIVLKANIDQPLEDVWQEDDRYWLFTLKRNLVPYFQGYVSTSDMEQPYNSKEWDLNFDAFGHLHYLENVGYFDSSGLPYSGRDTLFNIIVKCLNRTYNDLDPKIGYRLSHHLEYNSTPLFENVYLDQDQFYDDEGESQDCKTIVEDILKSLGCFMVQHDQNYLIISVRNFLDTINSDVDYRQMSSTGVFQFASTLSPVSEQRIGDAINGADIHHINTNQRFITRKFYNSFKVRHNFIYADQILPNGELIGAGGAMPDWTIAVGETTVVGDTLEIDGVELESSRVLAANSSTISLKQGDVLEVVIVAEYITDPTEQVYEILLENTTSGTDYSYTSYEPTEGSEPIINEWVQLPVGALVRREIEFSPTENEFTHTIQLAALPEDGDLTFKAYNGVFGSAFTASSKTILKSVTIKALEQPLEAEEFIIERDDKSTGEVPEVYEVKYNTTDRNILTNIFLDSSGVAIPTFNDGAINIQSARQLSREFMMLYSDNGKIFSGDLYNNSGFTPKRIDFLGTYYVITNESRDLLTKISSTELSQLSRSIPTTTETQNRVFKEPIKPTIK